MREIVPGDDPDHVSQRFCAAIPVNPDSVPHRTTDPRPEAEMPGTQRREGLERRSDIAGIVRTKLRPAILIETLEDRAVERENLTEPVAECEFGIGEMLDHANDGPAAWPLRAVERLARNGAEQSPEIGNGRGQNGQRIRVTDERRHTGGEGNPSIGIPNRGCLRGHHGKRSVVMGWRRLEPRVEIANEIHDGRKAAGGKKAKVHRPPAPLLRGREKGGYQMVHQKH